MKHQQGTAVASERQTDAKHEMTREEKLRQRLIRKEERERAGLSCMQQVLSPIKRENDDTDFIDISRQ